MSKDLLFIGIPCYQESEMLHRTVRAIERTSEWPHHLEVHIAPQSVVKNKNALLAKTRTLQPRYVAFCDDDIEPEQGWDRKLITALEYFQHKYGLRIGQTTPLLLLPDGEVFSLWVNITIDPEKKTGQTSSWRYGPYHSYYRAYGLVPALAGTCTIFTSDFLHQVDWRFDERYEKSQYEDLDQSLVCRELGFQLLYNGYVTVIHHQPKISPRDPERNKIRFFEKWSAKPWLSMSVSHQWLGITAASPIPWQRWYAYTFHAIREAFRHPIKCSWKALRVLYTEGPHAIIQRIRQSLHEW